jgi:hypothetical protein
VGLLDVFFKREVTAPVAVTPANVNLCLYIIGFADPRFHGIVKIGVTKQLTKRLATLQTGCPWRLEVKALVYRPDSFEFEKWLHEYFDQYRMRPDGEWFDFGPGSDPVTMVESAR